MSGRGETQTEKEIRCHSAIGRSFNFFLSYFSTLLTFHFCALFFCVWISQIIHFSLCFVWRRYLFMWFWFSAVHCDCVDDLIGQEYFSELSKPSRTEKRTLSLHSTLKWPFERVKFNLSNCIDRYRPRFEIHSLYLCPVGDLKVERLNDIENNQKPVWDRYRLIQANSLLCPFNPFTYKYKPTVVINIITLLRVLFANSSISLNCKCSPAQTMRPLKRSKKHRQKRATMLLSWNISLQFYNKHNQLFECLISPLRLSGSATTSAHTRYRLSRKKEKNIFSMLRSQLQLLMFHDDDELKCA